MTIRTLGWAAIVVVALMQGMQAVANDAAQSRPASIETAFIANAEAGSVMRDPAVSSMSRENPPIDAESYTHRDDAAWRPPQRPLPG